VAGATSEVRAPKDDMLVSTAEEEDAPLSAGVVAALGFWQQKRGGS
jgi:hypothetical protein